MLNTNQQQQQPQQSVPANKPSAKSNHRLVSKLKDARHRRRHRHHRHRQLLASAAVATDKAAIVSSLVASEPQQATALLALESIVEEVARAGGQLPAPAQVIQQHASTQASQASSASELLLDGSSSPISHLQPAQAQQQPQAPTVLQQAPTTQPLTAVATRSPPFNSRGFFLTSMLSKIMNVLNVTEFALEMRDGISSRASCMACNAVVGLFLSPLYSKEVFSAAIRTVCTSFKIQSARVCHGLVESFQDDFEYIRKNTKLTRDEVCAVVFGVDCARRQTYNLFWTVPIPERSAPTSQAAGSSGETSGASNPSASSASTGISLPINEHSLTNMDDAPDLFEYRKSNSAATAKQESLKQQATIVAASKQISELGAKDKQAKALKRPEYIFDDDLYQDNSQMEPSRQQSKSISSFVHITDIHIDPYYEAGSLNDCNEPLCCRATSGPVAANDKRRQAGRWGDYGNCDTPVRTLVSALNRIREQHSSAEYWIWTGDISPHDIWNISKAEAANHVRLVSKLVREYSNGLPVFPVIGNHEAHPVNR